MLKSVNYSDITAYVNERLEKIILYDKNHQSDLLETLYTYIESKFNVKKTAEKLFIHYNSVRYRLDILSTLGIHISQDDNSHFDIYFALFFHMNFISIHKI